MWATASKLFKFIAKEKDMSKIAIAPSILAADFAKIGEEVQALEAAGADIIHFDVMDGNFVEKITFGSQMLQAVQANTNLPLDVHLMVTNPQNKIKDFVNAGANFISFHIEALQGNMKNKLEQAIVILQEIQSYGIEAGIAVNPKTDIADILPLLLYCNFILIMSVQAGLGGQSFIESTLQKAEKVKEYIAKNNLHVVIEMDGGITLENIHTVQQAGVTRIVAGSTIFKVKDRAKIIQDLRKGM